MSQDPEERRGEGAFLTAFVVGSVVLAFVAGAVLTTAKVFPGTAIANAYSAGTALYSKITDYSDRFATDLWQPARSPARGVTQNDPARSQPGVTLYTSGHEAAAFLIDQDGTVLHEWRKPFSEVWDASSPIETPQPDSHVYFRKAQVLPNGDLLALYEGAGDTPYGYALVKLNKDSEPLWLYPGRTHHSFDVAPDGRIYVLTHAISDARIEGFDQLAPPRIEDYLVILSPDGQELKKIDLLQSVARSPYRHLLHAVSSYAVGDPLHSNDADLIGPAAARVFPFGKAGQVLLSFRELGGGTLAVLDTEREEIVWATRGPWLGQHDPDITDSGTLTLFDNYGNYEVPAGRSRVLEIDPRDMRIAWQYAGDADRPLESLIRSAQQRLANGNTLITESDGGRILEVAADGSLVWEFLNPVRGGNDQSMIPIICWAQRLAEDSFEPGFLAQLRAQSHPQKDLPS